MNLEILGDGPVWVIPSFFDGLSCDLKWGEQSREVDEVQRQAVGNQAGGRVLFFLRSDNFDADYERLLSKGIEFTEEPRVESYGKIAVFLDVYGNRIDLIGSVN